jgi:hypothetical protein
MNHACSIYREEWATGKGRGGEGVRGREKKRKEKDESLAVKGMGRSSKFYLIRFGI